MSKLYQEGADTLNVNLSISIPLKSGEKIFGCITLLLNNNSYVIRDAYRNTDRSISPKEPQRVQNNSMVKWHEITLPIIIIIAQFPQQLKLRVQNRRIYATWWNYDLPLSPHFRRTYQCDR